MNRVLRALLVVVCFEMGALLLYLPWSGLWEQNFLSCSTFRRSFLYCSTPLFAVPSAASECWTFCWPLASLVLIPVLPVSLPNSSTFDSQLSLGQQANPMLRHGPSRFGGASSIRLV